jgi:hypothetical protein
VTQRIDLMPDSCKAKLGRKRQIRFWIAMYAVTAMIIISGNMLFELSKGQLRNESAMIGSKVSLDAKQRVKAKQVLDEIKRIEIALDRNARIAWPINISDVIKAIGSQAPDAVYLTKIAIVPRQDRTNSSRRGKKEDGPTPLPRVRIQIECAGVAPDNRSMARFVAGLESHPLFERLAVEHVKPVTVEGNDAKEFGLTFEVDFFNRFEFEQADAGGLGLAGSMLEPEVGK